jgi:CRISP-associated protein Cas1
LERVANQQTLFQGWQDLRHRTVLPDPEVEAAERKIASTLALVSEQLLDGTWRPHQVHRVALLKPKGGRRVLGIPPVIDRVVERALLSVLDPIVDPELLPWSFAFRRGLGDGCRSCSCCSF